MEHLVWTRRTRPVPPLPDNDRMAALVGIHEGERIIVLGNGPSLLDADLAWLDGEITMGVNRAYLLPAYNLSLAQDWQPTYAAWTDHGRIDYCPSVYAGCQATFTWRHELDGNHPNVRDWPNCVLWDEMAWSDRRAEERRYLLRSEYQGILQLGSTAISACHLAFVLGAAEVVVIGCDGTYDERGRSHFYSPPGVMGLHDYDRMMVAWNNMRQGWLKVQPAWPGPVIDLSPAPGIGEVYRAAA